MRRIIRILTFGIVVATMATGCATTSYYHIKKGSGGFSRTKLANNTYEVQITGASPSKMGQFLFRRCAQITLEHGKRYFIIFSRSQSDSHAEAKYISSSLSSSSAIIKILNNKSEGKHSAVADAVTVIKQTNKIAKGKLSAKARKTFNQFVTSDNR